MSMSHTRRKGRWQFGLRTMLLSMVLVGPVVWASGPVGQWIYSLFEEDPRSYVIQAPTVQLFNGDDSSIRLDD